MRPYDYGSLFSGAGLKDIGAEQAGFVKRFSCEIAPHAIRCLKKNWPHVPNYGDVEKLGPQQISMMKGVSLLAASPPCQGFSKQNPRRNSCDPRNDLTFKTIPLIGLIQPRVAIIENVRGMTEGPMKEIFERVKNDLGKLNYNSQYMIMNAVHYGVPQRRERVIIVAVRDDLKGTFCFPQFNREEADGLRMRHIMPHVQLMSRHRISQSPMIYHPSAFIGTITASQTWKFLVDGKWRRPTTDELMRIMTVPDGYQWPEPRNYVEEVARLGNGVPCEMFHRICLQVQKLLDAQP